MFNIPWRRSDWRVRIENKLDQLMTALDDELAAIKAAQADTSTKLAAVKTDVEALLAKVAAMPVAGLTPDQQTALDGILATAAAVNTNLGAIDAEANPPAAAKPTT